MPRTSGGAIAGGAAGGVGGLHDLHRASHFHSPGGHGAGDHRFGHRACPRMPSRLISPAGWK